VSSEYKVSELSTEIMACALTPIGADLLINTSWG